MPRKTLVTNEARAVKAYSELIANKTGGSIRYEKMGSQEYIVAPVSMLVPGVLNGSKGPLYYPQEEVTKNVRMWNNMPLTLGHPTDDFGNGVSARSPKVLEKFALGFVFNATGRNGKLDAEAWFDIDRTNRLAPEVVKRLEAGEPIELSTGLFTKNMPVGNGRQYNGKPYVAIAKDYEPDHLAVLPYTRGACSLEDGCGVLINEEAQIDYTTNSDEGCFVYEDGTVQFVQNNEVPADRKLNKPFRTPNANRKFGVYTKNDSGNVVLVRFGDPNMEIKRDSDSRRASFQARHNCSDPGPKWKPRYWSCQMWRSDKSVQDMIGNEGCGSCPDDGEGCGCKGCKSKQKKKKLMAMNMCPFGPTANAKKAGGCGAGGGKGKPGFQPKNTCAVGGGASGKAGKAKSGGSAGGAGSAKAKVKELNDLLASRKEEFRNAKGWTQDKIREYHDGTDKIRKQIRDLETPSAKPQTKKAASKAGGSDEPIKVSYGTVRPSQLGYTDFEKKSDAAKAAKAVGGKVQEVEGQNEYTGKPEKFYVVTGFKPPSKGKKKRAKKPDNVLRRSDGMMMPYYD